MFTGNLVNFVLNNDWEHYITKFGKLFFDKVAEVTFEFSKRFYEQVPATKYISNIDTKK